MEAETTAYATEGPVFAQFELITPDCAREYLENCNKMNRKMRPAALRMYRDAMENGDWNGLNGDTIVFDVDGYLVDGQHRLQAIADSDCGQEVLVVRDVTPESRVTKDDNVRRRFSDDLTMNGVISASAKDSLLRKIVLWDTRGGLGTWVNVRLRRQELSRLWGRYAKQIEETEENARRWNMRWPGNQSAMHFAYWLLRFRVGCWEQEVDKFFSVISIGSQASEDEVLIKLRDRLTRPVRIMPNGGRKMATVDMEVWWLVQAWNAWVTGRVTRYETPRGGFTDPYPLPVLVERTGTSE